jgi:ATP-dependent Lon protease
MRDFRDAKAMAQTLREALTAKSVSLTHSESLELVAKVLGFRDWNVLSARIQSEPLPPDTNPLAPDANLDTAIWVAATPAPSGTALPVVPLRDVVLFPHMIAPIYAGRATTKQAVERATAADKRFLAVTQRLAADDNPTRDALYSVGVTASVIDAMPLADGTLRLIVNCHQRAAIAHLAEGPFLAAEIKPIEETRGRDPEAFAMSRTVLEKVQARLNINLSSPPYQRLLHITEPGILADAVAPFLSNDVSKRQDLLETTDVITRLEKILALMKTDQQAA